MEDKNIINSRNSELLFEGFKTNDVVQIEGSLQQRDLKRVRINGLPPISLNNREYLVLLALAIHVLKRKTANSFPPGNEVFISCNSLIDTIDKLKTLSGSDLRAFQDATQNDVVRVISRLRKRLHKNGNNPNLIETSRGYGYRLSAPAHNVSLNAEIIRHWDQILPPRPPMLPPKPCAASARFQ